MLFLALIGLAGIGLLMRAWRIRSHLALSPESAAVGVSSAIAQPRDGPVAVHGRASRHGSAMLAAPASGHHCVWWRLRAVYLYGPFTRTPPTQQTATSPQPFCLSDQDNSIVVEGSDLLTYGLPDRFHARERIPPSWSPNVAPVTERLREPLPDLVPPIERGGVRAMIYTEWSINEDEEITITGEVVTDPQTGRAVLRPHRTAESSEIFSLTLGADQAAGHDELTRSYRRSVRLGYLFLAAGLVALVCGLNQLLDA